MAMSINSSHSSFDDPNVVVNHINFHILSFLVLVLHPCCKPKQNFTEFSFLDVLTPDRLVHNGGITSSDEPGDLVHQYLGLGSQIHIFRSPH